MRTAREGERACEELRAHGIDCDCVARAEPGSAARELTVVVAPADVHRALDILEDWSTRNG
ncbi:MAG TPA: hypothetical protein VGK79_17670 [Gaiellaceae bacterium]